jgi:23S rRNA pseudouridine955/2504/2580 synthase
LSVTTFDLDTKVLKLKVNKLEKILSLDKYLKSHTSIPYSLIQKLIRKKDIKINGVRCNSKSTVDSDDQIEIYGKIITQHLDNKQTFCKATYDKIFKSLKTNIIFENNDVIAFNKEAGINVQGGTNIKCSIDNVLEEFKSNDIKPRLVHRLDRETSGVLIVAKNLETAETLGNLFKSKNIKKKYSAIVKGRTPKKSDLVILDLETENGKIQNSITRYREVQNFGNRHSLVEFYPETGRKHQIRIAAKHLGCPIVGDKKYGERDRQKNMMLHCSSMKFNIGKTDYLLQATLPDYFKL